MSRHEDWCDPGPRGTAAIVDPKHPTRGTCPKCGYVGPLRARSGSLYPHKRFDRYAPEPASTTCLAEPACRATCEELRDTLPEIPCPCVSREPLYRCPRCYTAAPWTDGIENVPEFWCQTCGAETPLDQCEVVSA